MAKLDNTESENNLNLKKVDVVRRQSHTIDLGPLLRNMAREKSGKLSDPIEYSRALGAQLAKITALDQTVKTNKNYLQIESFKKIRESIQLSDLTRVNYIVGRNGHGKSSLLTAISYLSESAANLERPLLTENSRLEVRFRGKRRTLQTVDGNRGLDGSAIVEAFILKEQNVGHLGTVTDPSLITGLDQKGFELLNHVASDVAELSPILARRIFNENDVWSDDSGRRAFFEEENELNIPLIAQGVQSLFSLQSLLNHAKSTNLPHVDANLLKRVILVEEPENNLHPALQKKIPSILEHYLDSLPANLRRNTYIFVSTHSPFIVGAAGKLPAQKVYLLENGHLLAKTESDHGNVTLEKVTRSSGYNGRDCAWVVSQMLGGDVTDLGYPENYCLLEENSLYKILKSCVDKGILANYQFIAARGVSHEINLEERLNELSKVDTLVKCNPYYWSTYRVIMDNTGREAIGKKVQQRVDKMKERLGNRFTELSKDTLEEYYTNINVDLYRRAMKHIGQATTPSDQGRAKEDAAGWAADHINSKQDFTQLFGGELDFLFKP